jgi:hypothetical protein
MKNILLGVIAINLTFISGNLYLKSVEPVQAEVSPYQIEEAIKDALDYCSIEKSYGDVYYFSC